ncbi:MAG: TonB-dependent receptor [Acidobacteria bacterium]|nr:TonB-dependent receptor [Acidobacteriota bacterium]
MSKVFASSVVLCLLAVAIPASAQLQSGTIYGTVQDAQAGVLPGVTLTLSSTDRTVTFVTESDGKFRFLNLPPGAYTVSAELSGFKTVKREQIIIIVGSNVEINITMQVAAVQETITVTGESPIVDTKQMGTATNFTQDELSKIPTSRDPWALLRTVPGIVVDRINIAGNETGQQSGFASKGTRREDAVWTMDGVVITDMAAVGASPTYFDMDSFAEIQVSTGGQDISQPTGGVGLNFVVKRGTNQYKGSARSYFTGDSLEDSNVPDELRARGVTPNTADHNKQISEWGFELGGPLMPQLKDKVWLWGALSEQDIRLVRQAGNFIDKTDLKNSTVKGTWKLSEQDTINGLWFLTRKIKSGRPTGAVGREAPTATWNQGNAYPDGPHGLLKFEDNHVFSSSLFVSARWAYYGTGFSLTPIGGLDQQAGRSARLGESFGSVNLSRFTRPENFFSTDGSYFRNWLGANHDFKFGFGYRRNDAFSQTIWPGNMILALDNSVTNQRARVFREGAGNNRARYLDFFVADTVTMDRWTINAGVRYDRQWGSTFDSQTRGNPAFPDLVPGIVFGGERAPFTWNNVSPRVGATYALDADSKTILRASFSRFAAQLDNGTVGFNNLSSQAGFVDFPWSDRNGDHFAQADEIDTTRVLTFGGGFNPANPTSGVSANQIDPGLDAPTTNNIVVGIDRELRRNVAVSVAYTYGRTSDFSWTPWIGLTAADFTPGTPVTGTLPGGTPFSIPIFIPNAAKIAANGNGRILSTRPDYHTSFHGIEVTGTKRLSDRWMARLSFAYNNAREFFGGNPPLTSFGNPTRTDTDSLVSGGQSSPRSAGSGAGDVFINGKWQVNLNGMYQLPWYEIEVAGNLFGKQGTPFPFWKDGNLGNDGSNRILVTPKVDTERFDNLWNLDLRVAKTFHYDRFSAQLIADLFNVFNSDTELNRERNIASPNFDRLNVNLSPRIVRLGVRLGF